MNVITRAWDSVKAATARLTMRWSRASSFGLTWLAGTAYDYQGAAGDGRTNAAVMACLRWAQRTITEAPLIVQTRTADGEWQPAPTHPLQDRLSAPNPHHGGMELIGQLIPDLILGNAYIRKVRNGGDGIAELWWIPAAQIEPRWPEDGSVFISHYEYAVDGIIENVAPEDIIHLRSLMSDPQNTRKGLSELAALYREIATDNEGANWTSSLLRNQAIPGVVISPADKDASPTQADLDDVKEKFKQRFGGDNRGEPLVMKGATRVDVLSFNPDQMNLRDLRIIPEERITAVLGIPAIVVGLGAGLQRSTFANFEEARQAAYDGFVLPMQRLIAQKLQSQLVKDFGDPNRLRVVFDTSNVGILQDDQNALHERARADLGAGLLTLNQALQMIGADPVEGEAGDVRYIPNTVTVKTLDTLIPEEQPAALTEPTPLRALPAPAEDGAAAGKGVLPSALKAADLSDADLLARFDAGISTLSEDLADDLLGAFEELADVAAERAMGFIEAQDAHAPGGKDWSAQVSVNQLDAGTRIILKDDIVSGLVTLADHEPIKRLLRSYVLKSMRQAAEDLAPLTGGAVRIQRNTPAVKEAIAEMEARLPGIAETTASDFGRLIRRLERRPGSVSLDEVRSALVEYIGESYPSRAENIAATELSYAHARGVIHVAEKSGIASRVAIADGDGDGPCKERNGTTATLEEARGIGLLHPRCALRLIPILAA